MAFPAYAPASRSFDPGDWPVKAFNAQDGAEVRILYGTKRTSMKLSLSYSALKDVQAEEFLHHFIEMKGTYSTFEIADGTKAGWEGSSSSLDVPSGSKWRYAEPPQLESIFPGVSNVSVSLVGVF